MSLPPLKSRRGSPRCATSPLNVADFLGRPFLNTTLEELLSRTRTGLVFRAAGPQGPVAVKLFHPGPLAEPAARRRFLRGIEIARSLKHPRLVAMHDGGIEHGVPYTSSEYVAGESAAQAIQRIGVAGMLDWRTTLRIGLDLAAALQFLAQHGVIHRSITPQHILISAQDGTAKLNDLLLTKDLDGGHPAITNAGETVGELSYLSPEQVSSGQPIDERSDVYQLGATLYALLTGRPPFEGRGPAEIIQQILQTVPSSPTRHHLSIPPLLEGAVLTMLHKRPADRFASASDLERELKRVQRFSDSP